MRLAALVLTFCCCCCLAARAESYDQWKARAEEDGLVEALEKQRTFVADKLGKRGIDPAQFDYNPDPERQTALRQGVDEAIELKDQSRMIDAYDKLFQYNNLDWCKAAGFDPSGPDGQAALKAVAQFAEAMWKNTRTDALDKSVSAKTAAERRQWRQTYDVVDAGLQATQRRIKAYSK
jgi:hypothetical protein